MVPTSPPGRDILQAFVLKVRFPEVNTHPSELNIMLTGDNQVSKSIPSLVARTVDKSPTVETLPSIMI